VTTHENVVPSLQKRYPQLAQLLDDLDGFHKFVCIRLKNFKLDRRYSPNDIISECILRWHQAFEKGKEIPNITAWMKLTATYVIRELKRESNKTHPYDPAIVETFPDISRGDNLESKEQKQMVLTALAALSKDKRELLELRFFQNLSWDEVAAFYTAHGEKTTTAALRKRGERALKELKKVFLEMLRE